VLSVAKMLPHASPRRERRDEGKEVIACWALIVPGCTVQVPGGTEGEVPSVSTFSFTMTGAGGTALHPLLVDLTSTCVYVP